MDRPIFRSLLFVLIATSCRDAPLAENVKSNRTPLADAGEMQTLDYEGSPVTVRLDGSGSSDADGEIAEYRWFNGDLGADGRGRGEPDPDDVERPEVTLERGVWKFVLFVVDADGGVSRPSTVTITVGDAVPPEVLECANDALESIEADCRLCLCGVSDLCRTAVAGCDQACWDFYGCVQNQCGELASDEQALANCVRTNCASFFAGVGGYMPLQPCLDGVECRDVCADSVQR